MIQQLFIPPHLILTALVLWILPLVRVIESKTKKWYLKSYISVIWSILLITVIIWEIIDLGNTSRKIYVPFDGNDYREIEFVLTSTRLYLLLFVTLLFSSIMLYSVRYLRWESLATDEGDYKMYYYFLMFASYLGLSVVLFANDAFTIFVGWEIMVVPAYALVSSRPRAKSAEAGIKYALQSSLGSIFFLFGISVLYEITGTFNLDLITQRLAELDHTNNILAWEAIIFILVGIGVTAGIIGFHTWIPDAYGEAPSTVGAFISGGFTIGSTFVLYQLIIVPFTGFGINISQVLIWVGIITMSVGNLGAIKQEDVRRLLGYSSIAQRGYIIFGLGVVANATVELSEGFTIVLVQALSYLLLEGLLFLAIGNLLYLHYQHHESRSIDILQGAAKSHTVTAVVIILTSLGLAGLPPTFGFAAKLGMTLLVAQNIGILPLLFFLSNSVISLFYYIRLSTRLIYDDTELEEKENIPPSMIIAILLPVILVVLMNIRPDFWMEVL